jgi:hypothetical protein
MKKDMLLVFYVQCYDEICLQDYFKTLEKSFEYVIILVHDIDVVTNMDFSQLEHDWTKQNLNSELKKLMKL